MAIVKGFTFLLLFFSSFLYGMKGPKKILMHPNDAIAQSPTLNALDEDGKAPLHYAVLKGNCAEIAALLSRGASLLTRTNDTGATVFHLAAHLQNLTIKKTLLFFALLQQGDALIKDIAQATKNKPFALGVLQERAIQLKKLLQVTTKDGQTACSFERNQNPSYNVDSPAPLLSAHKVHTDLQAFVAAIENKLIHELPENNVFKAAQSVAEKL